MKPIVLVRNPFSERGVYSTLNKEKEARQ